MNRSRKKIPLFLLVFFTALVLGAGSLFLILGDSEGSEMTKHSSSYDNNDINPAATGEKADESKTNEEIVEETGSNNEEDTTPSGKTYQTIAGLNLREGPSLEADIILTIPAGENVEYLSSSGYWYKVKYGEQIGYVSSEYLIDNELPANEFTEPTYIQGVLVVNKKYGLPADYAPGENQEAREAFNKMAEDAKLDGIALEAFSTYRSYEYQKQLYNYYVSVDGQAEADRYSARPGHSEHQTGLAFDIGLEGDHENRFNESDATRWLAEHAYKYGFILRYPEGKEHITGYKYEPWHYRYVGVDMATKVYESGLTLEEYLGID